MTVCCGILYNGSMICNIENKLLMCIPIRGITGLIAGQKKGHGISRDLLRISPIRWNQHQMAADKQYQPTPTKDKKKAQLSHALIDVDLCDKPKIKSLTYKFGPLAQLYLIRLIMMMSRATDALIDDDAALCVAQELGMTNGFDVLDYLVANELIQRVNGKLTQIRVIQDQQKLQKQRDEWRDRQARIREMSRNKNEDVTRDIPVTGGRIRELLNTEVLNTESSSKEIAKPERNLLGQRDLGYGIHISEIDYPAVQLTFLRFGLDEKWIERGACRLAAWYDKNPTKRTVRGPYLDLVSWAVERCVEEKNTLEKAKNTQKLGQKFKDLNAGRPSSPSPPVENEEIVIRHAPTKGLVEDLAKRKSV